MKDKDKVLKCCLRCRDYLAIFINPKTDFIYECGRIACTKFKTCKECVDYGCDYFWPESQTG